jgi:hypothetical protein
VSAPEAPPPQDAKTNPIRKGPSDKRTNTKSRIFKRLQRSFMDLMVVELARDINEFATPAKMMALFPWTRILGLTQPIGEV